MLLHLHSATLGKWRESTLGGMWNQVILQVSWGANPANHSVRKDQELYLLFRSIDIMPYSHSVFIIYIFFKLALRKYLFLGTNVLNTSHVSTLIHHFLMPAARNSNSSRMHDIFWTSTSYKVSWIRSSIVWVNKRRQGASRGGAGYIRRG